MVAAQHRIQHSATCADLCLGPADETVSRHAAAHFHCQKLAAAWPAA